MTLLTQRITADLAAISLASLNITSSGIFDELIRLVEFNTDAAEAFNAAGWPISPSMPIELREHIVLLHRQNRTRYISRAIMGYYHRDNYKNLNELVETWESHPLFAPRLHNHKGRSKSTL